jgi:hypothetical protein
LAWKKNCAAWKIIRSEKKYLVSKPRGMKRNGAADIVLLHLCGIKYPQQSCTKHCTIVEIRKKYCTVQSTVPRNICYEVRYTWREFCSESCEVRAKKREWWRGIYQVAEKKKQLPSESYELNVARRDPALGGCGKYSLPQVDSHSCRGLHQLTVLVCCICRHCHSRGQSASQRERGVPGRTEVSDHPVQLLIVLLGWRLDALAQLPSCGDDVRACPVAEVERCGYIFVERLGVFLTEQWK